MIATKKYEFWFITGSQHLYGEETLRQVASDSAAIVKGLNESGALPWPVVAKPTLVSSELIDRTIAEAQATPECAGLIAWMHTFSPAKMWIRGLSSLTLPLLHLHTQFNRDIPWSGIDMDFMNLNQSAHGDREFGYITARLGTRRSIVAGHWQDKGTQARVASWMRAAAAVRDGRGMKIARFGDNMRNVAVTDGDKVAAQERFGWEVLALGTGSLAERVPTVNQGLVDALVKELAAEYEIPASILDDGAKKAKLAYQARIELALESLLDEGGFSAFTTNFEDLYGLEQLPGLASQRLMAKGYGFGAEGDWKTAAMLRAVKFMGKGLPGGSSFMEDYTYHMEAGNEMVLGAHMLEVCPSIASAKPRVALEPLGIGGKDDPARLIFEAAPGEALNASLIEFGDRFRLIVNTVTAVKGTQDMPKLPVARALWKPHPDFTTGLEGWIRAGGAHHTVYSQNVSEADLATWANLSGVEFVAIDKKATIGGIEREIAMADALASLGRSGFGGIR